MQWPSDWPEVFITKKSWVSRAGGVRRNADDSLFCLLMGGMASEICF